MPIHDQVKPWYTDTCIAFLDTLDLSGFKIFEYGSGGSTLYFGSRAESVITIEHDPEYFRQTVGRIREAGLLEKCQAELVKVARSDARLPKDDRYSYHDMAALGPNGRRVIMDFTRYVRAIDRYKDQYFDLVSVDGRARQSCLRHSTRKICVGGLLVLDNSERTEYQRAIQEFLGDRTAWEPRHFPGRFKGVSAPGRTTFWRRIS